MAEMEMAEARGQPRAPAATKSFPLAALEVTILLMGSSGLRLK